MSIYHEENWPIINDYEPLVSEGFKLLYEIEALLASVTNDLLSRSEFTGP